MPIVLIESRGECLPVCGSSGEPPSWLSETEDLHVNWKIREQNSSEAGAEEDYSSPCKERKARVSRMINYRMSHENPSEILTGVSLLKATLHLKIFALTTIVVLSTGIVVIVYGQLRQGGPLAGAVENPSELLRSFVFLMLLTAGYLVGKSWTISRFQRQLLDRLLEKEFIARAQRRNPVTQFHHPDVCRDILLRQAIYAKRQQVPLSILEITLHNLAQLPKDKPHQLIPAESVENRWIELIGQLKRLCRPLDSLLRWSPDSFLLVLSDISPDELPTIQHRVERELEKWLENRFEAASRPVLGLRSFSSSGLDTTIDILTQIQHLLDDGNNSLHSASDDPSEWKAAS